MTNLKDKLSASVRQAKATQQDAATPTPATPAAAAVKPSAPAKPAAAAAKPAAPARPATSTRSTAAKRDAAKPAAAKPVANRTPAQRPSPAGALPGDIQESGGALFPERVWPD